MMTSMEEIDLNSEGDAWYWRTMAIFCVITFITITAVSLLPRKSMPDPTYPGWPPALNFPYPDLELVNFDGRRIKISDLKGKPTLIHLSAMSSPASQAFSGASRAGPFGNVQIQTSFQSLEDYFARYSGGVPFTDPGFNYVQIIFYDLDMQAPNVDELREWARHFHLERQANAYVLGGTSTLMGGTTYKRIPGFQLLNKDSVMLVDVTGSKPRQGLFEDLLPAIPGLMQEK
jgi:hypothetical protein